MLPLEHAAKVHVDDIDGKNAGGDGCGSWLAGCCGSLVVLMRLVYWECVHQRNLLWRWHVALARLLPNEALRRVRLASARQRQLWTDMNNQGPVVLRAEKEHPPTTPPTTASNDNDNNSPTASMFQVAADAPREIRAMLVPAALAQGRSLLTHALMPRPQSRPPLTTMEEPISGSSNVRDVATTNGVNDDGEQGQGGRAGAIGGEEDEGMEVLPVLTSNRGSSGGFGGAFVFARRYRYMVEYIKHEHPNHFHLTRPQIHPSHPYIKSLFSLPLSRFVVEYTSSAQEALRRMVHRHLLGGAAYDARHQVSQWLVS